MYVRRLKEQEILDALHLAWEVFEEYVAPLYSPQGVEEFQNFIKYEDIIPKVQSREMVFFAAIEGTEMCGISAIRRDGHISLLFVRKNYQKQGAARRLCNAMQQYCVIERRIVKMSVNASPNAVIAYQHMGFSIVSDEKEDNGIRYTPMEYIIRDAKEIAGSVIQVQGKKSSGKLKGFLLGLALSTIIGGLFIGYSLGSSLREKNNSEENNQSTVITEDGNVSDSESGETSENRGIEAIDAYIAENLSYTIEEESYTYYSDKSSKEYKMQFEVKYPQIKGSGSEKEQEINQILKDCAMSTVNVLYLNPSEQIKEAMLKIKNPVLLSQVTYRVTFASNDFISIVFNDMYCTGDTKIGYVDLRTRNINLKDGSLYEVQDIISPSDAFMKQWKSRLQSEAPGLKILETLRTSEYRKIINGEMLNGSYSNAFFVDRDGMEIGFTYHYQDEKRMENGWITAPFTIKEAESYKTDSSFWNIVKVKIDE